MAQPEENRGSGTTLDDPIRIPAMHPAFGISWERVLISKIFGEQDRDWFDAGRVNHAKNVCEQRIRLNSGQIRQMFFDTSKLDYSLELPDDVRAIFERASTRMRVPDVTLISRFPLVEVKATTAAEAGRIICTHLEQARKQGWTVGIGRMFVDGWRNEYDLVRGSEKTILCFDMRPALVADSRMNLMLFSAAGSLDKIDMLEQRLKAEKSGLPSLPQVDWRRACGLIVKVAGIGAVIAAAIAYVASRDVGMTFLIGVGAFLIIAVFMLCQLRPQALRQELERRRASNQL